MTEEQLEDLILYAKNRIEAEDSSGLCSCWKQACNADLITPTQRRSIKKACAHYFKDNTKLYWLTTSGNTYRKDRDNRLFVLDLFKEILLTTKEYRKW